MRGEEFSVVECCRPGPVQLLASFTTLLPECARSTWSSGRCKRQKRHCGAAGLRVELEAQGPVFSAIDVMSRTATAQARPNKARQASSLGNISRQRACSTYAKCKYKTSKQASDQRAPTDNARQEDLKSCFKPDDGCWPSQRGEHWEMQWPAADCWQNASTCP